MTTPRADPPIPSAREPGRAFGRLPDRRAALAVPGLHLHDYGKNEARPGRKLGHATVVAASIQAREAALRRARRLA